MSNSPENELDLEKLFLPAWAQEPSSTKSYANYEVREDRSDRREGFRGPRPPRREGPGGGGPRRDRPQGERRGPRPEGAGRPGGPGPRQDRPGGGRGPRPGGGRPDFRREQREPVKPLPELIVTVVPEERGVESLARQIKMTGRAYPLFDIAQLILQKPERHEFNFQVKKNAEGQPIQPLFLCMLDDTLWLSEDEAVSHVLNKHFSTFYQADKTATEPPKGKYTFVGQCGISGVILGPPNHHDYQNQLRRLHAERFSRMPFETFKSRVKIVRDEEVVKKWVEDQSWRTEYICLNMPEPLRLDNMEAVTKHFRETHKDTIIKQVDSHRLSGNEARNLRTPDLVRTVRQVIEDQRRFPLQIATVLSQQFARHGLHFFKVNKTITHVSVSRPHYLDLEAVPVSEGVRKIVQFINTNPKCTRRKLVESLAPTPPTPVILPPPPAAPPIVAPVAPVPGGTPAPEAAGEAAPDAPPAPAQPAAPQQPAGPTPEQNAVISDLHWLIHQGHVIEFANGTLEAAKKPAPKPPKPPKPEPAPAAATPETGETATAPAPAAEPAATTEAAPASAPEPAAAPAEAAAAPETGSAPAEPAPAPVQLSDGTAPADNTAMEVEPPPAPQGEPAPPASPVDPEKQA